MQGRRTPALLAIVVVASAVAVLLGGCDALGGSDPAPTRLAWGDATAVDPTDPGEDLVWEAPTLDRECPPPADIPVPGVLASNAITGGGCLYVDPATLGGRLMITIGPIFGPPDGPAWTIADARTLAEADAQDNPDTVLTDAPQLGEQAFQVVGADPATWCGYQVAAADGEPVQVSVHSIAGSEGDLCPTAAAVAGWMLTGW